MTLLDFGRDCCSNLAVSGTREWLVTNSIGGYASGTIAGLLTRRYHGLLIAALQPPVMRHLLVSKFEETTIYDSHIYPLFANRWASGVVEPNGYVHLERFHLEGTTPVWTFACADALLEKRVWMEPEVGTADAALGNTTYVCYTLRRARMPLALSINAFVTYRDHHGNTRADDWPALMGIESVAHGLRVTAHEDAVPFYLLSDRAGFTSHYEWRRGCFLSVEDYRGLDPLEDCLCAGLVQATLQPGKSLTLVASTRADPELDGNLAYGRRQAYEQQLLERARPSLSPAPGAIKHLVLAADQFIVRRALPDDPEGRSIIAGYPWFGDWGRDVMISLPGLTLTVGRHDVAAHILRTFACFCDRGMLPNRFPDQGETPEYNTVDATLWYFEAVRAYYNATGDEALLGDLFPVLQEVVEWHLRGTRHQIRADPTDGLLYAGEAGVQLTWMDVKIGDWVVTPRTGKAVEINALWYNALRCIAEFARQLDKPATRYDALADRALAGFTRFWNPVAGYCYDVIDGPLGDDPALRPNQLIAVSLLHSPLDPSQQQGVVDACARHLLTSHGLRSLAPGDPAYTGHYGGDRQQRDAAYHQGTAWGWLIGPFISAHLRVYGNRELARSFLVPLLRHLADHGVGSISEIFDGAPPFTPHGCTAQAWSVAELLRAWQATQDRSST
jgi:predicted glycogen debranching enzyme